MTFDPVYFKRLRTLGLIEGTSTLLLFFIAMPLKYLAGRPEAVTIVGSAHGFLFLALVGMFVLAIPKLSLPPRLALAGVVGAVVPFGPFLVDRWLVRFADKQTSPT